MGDLTRYDTVDYGEDGVNTEPDDDGRFYLVEQVDALVLKLETDLNAARVERDKAFLAGKHLGFGEAVNTMQGKVNAEHAEVIDRERKLIEARTARDAVERDRDRLAEEVLALAEKLQTAQERAVDRLNRLNEITKVNANLINLSKRLAALVLRCHSASGFTEAELADLKEADDA